MGCEKKGEKSEGRIQNSEEGRQKAEFWEI
jgi:hypothetical protein